MGQTAACTNNKKLNMLSVCIVGASGKLGAFQGRITVLPGFTNRRAVIEKAVGGCGDVLTVRCTRRP